MRLLLLLAPIGCAWSLSPGAKNVIHVRYGSSTSQDEFFTEAISNGELDMGTWDPAEYTSAEYTKSLNAAMKAAMATGDRGLQRSLARKLEMIEEQKLVPGMFDMSQPVDDSSLTS